MTIRRLGNYFYLQPFSDGECFISQYDMGYGRIHRLVKQDIVGENAFPLINYVCEVENQMMLSINEAF